MARPYSTKTPLGRMMKEDGFTAYEFCAEADIAQTTLTQYLNERKPIDPTHLPRICRALNCTAEDLESMLPDHLKV